LAKVINRVAPGGILIIGSHEKLPTDLFELKLWKGSTYIFQKQY
jgi:hypothetical protein